MDNAATRMVLEHGSHAWGTPQRGGPVLGPWHGSRVAPHGSLRVDSSSMLGQKAAEARADARAAEGTRLQKLGQMLGLQKAQGCWLDAGAWQAARC